MDQSGVEVAQDERALLALVARREPRVVVGEIEDVLADVVHQLDFFAAVVEIADKDPGDLRVLRRDRSGAGRRRDYRRPGSAPGASVKAGKVKVMPCVNCAPVSVSGFGPMFMSSMNSKSLAITPGSAALSAGVGAVGE